SALVAPNFCHALGSARSQSQDGGGFTGARQPEHDSGLCQSQFADAAGGGPTLAWGGATMKARSLKWAVAFYLQSRRRLGFALESEGGLLQNLVAYAHQLGHQGALTSELALNWAQVPPPANRLQRARRLVAVRHFALFWTAFDPRTQVPPAGLFGSAYERRG